MGTKVSDFIVPRLDHQPVVAIIGQQSQMSMGAHYQQEVDLLTLFKDVAGADVQMVTTPEQVRHVITGRSERRYPSDL